VDFNPPKALPLVVNVMISGNKKCCLSGFDVQQLLVVTTELSIVTFD